MNKFSERLSWRGDVPVTLHIHSSVPEKFRKDIKAAAEVWNYNKKLIIISDNIIQGQINPILDNKNVIYYLDNIGEKLSTQATTNIRWRGDKIIDTDVLIFSKNFIFYSGDDNTPGQVSILSLMIHEFGHALGLEHNFDEGSDVMFPYLGENQNKFNLSEANKKSIACEY